MNATTMTKGILFFICYFQLLLPFTLAFGTIQSSVQRGGFATKAPLLKLSLSSSSSSSSSSPATQPITLDEEKKNILYNCVKDRSSHPSEIVPILQELKDKNVIYPIECIKDDGNIFEFVFTTSILKVPIVGKRLLRGYMPNREIFMMDFDNSVLKVRVETYPFVPDLNLTGDDLTWNNENGSMSFVEPTRKKKWNHNASKETGPIRIIREWKILYADDDLLVVETSRTNAINIYRRFK